MQASDRCDGASTSKAVIIFYITYFVRFRILSLETVTKQRSDIPKYWVLVKYNIPCPSTL